MGSITYNVQTGELIESEQDDVFQPSQEQLNQYRIAELQMLLQETDYVALSDYDQDKTEIKAQRQQWREEIRTLKSE